MSIAKVNIRDLGHGSVGIALANTLSLNPQSLSKAGYSYVHL